MTHHDFIKLGDWRIAIPNSIPAPVAFFFGLLTTSVIFAVLVDVLILFHFGISPTMLIVAWTLALCVCSRIFQLSLFPTTEDQTFYLYKTHPFSRQVGCEMGPTLHSKKWALTGYLDLAVYLNIANLSTIHFLYTVRTGALTSSNPWMWVLEAPAMYVIVHLTVWCLSSLRQANLRLRARRHSNVAAPNPDR